MWQTPQYWKLKVWYDRWHSRSWVILSIILDKFPNKLSLPSHSRIFSPGSHVHPAQSSCILCICADDRNIPRRCVVPCRSGTYLCLCVCGLVFWSFSLCVFSCWRLLGCDGWSFGYGGVGLENLRWRRFCSRHILVDFGVGMEEEVGSSYGSDDCKSKKSLK